MARERIAKQCVHQLKEAKIVEGTQQGDSEWSLPLHLAPKPGGVKLVCSVFKELNEKTVKDKYHVRHPKSLSNKLHGKKVFRSIDLKKGYCQIPIYKSHRKYTATITPFDTFQYRCMPIQLSNFSTNFQQMDLTLNDLEDVYVYRRHPDHNDGH